MFCKKCGEDANERYFHLGMCQRCYNYFRNGGTENIIPDKGRVEYDNRGCVICHICGRAYKRLGSHIKESHNMTIADYKESYGLCNNAKTTEIEYSKMMHDLAYKNGMVEQLQRCGYNTRIQKGQKHMRMGKKSRLQECLEKSDRYSKRR